MRTKPLLLVLLVGALIGAGIAGCGDSKEDEAIAQVCDARGDVSKQIDTLKGLTPGTATTSQIKDSLQAIGDALSKIASARKDLAGDRAEQVQAANEEFASTVKDTLSTVARTTSVQDAGAQLTAAAQKLAGSYESTFAKIDCSDQ